MTKQEVFLADGKKIESEVIHLGHVAEYTNNPDKQEMLMPVGGGIF